MIAVSPISPGGNAPLTQRLSQSVPLAPSEIRLLMDWQSSRRLVRRGQELIVEGRVCRMLFIVLEGIAIRYRILRNGRRHVLSVLLPGDIAGVPGCFFEPALYSIRTITDAWVSPVPVPQLLSLFQTHPQLAAKIFWSLSCEMAIYAEHLIGVGRRTALERVAHFLLELLTRLQAVKLADAQSFRLPVTQEVIADALGLSLQYLNQVLRRLCDDNMLRIKDKRIVVTDVEALAALVDFERNYLKPISIAALLDDAA